MGKPDCTHKDIHATWYTAVGQSWLGSPYWVPPQQLVTAPLPAGVIAKTCWSRRSGYPPNLHRHAPPQCWSMLARSGTRPSQKNNRADWNLFSEERSVSCIQISHIARHCRCLECRRYTNVGRTFAVFSLGTWCHPITNCTTCCQPQGLLDMDSGTKPSATAYNLQDRPLREDPCPLRADSLAVTLNIISIHRVTF